MTDRLAQLADYFGDLARRIPAVGAEPGPWQEEVVAAVGECLLDGTNRLDSLVKGRIPIARVAGFTAALCKLRDRVGRYSPSSNPEIAAAFSEVLSTLGQLEPQTGAPDGLDEREQRILATVSASDEGGGSDGDLGRRQQSGDHATTRMAAATPNPTKVFIIHGRNVAARNAVEQFVRCLGLEPLDFDQVSADLGGSVFIGEVVRRGLELAQGIIALFTPDEFSALRPAFRGPSEKQDDIRRWQSRPNVIFEAGMAYGMSRERTVLVTLGTEVSLFSDVSGIHTVRLDNNLESRKKLRQKLIGMRCRVDERADAWTDPDRAGDFETCVNGLREASPQDPFADPKAAPPAPAGGPVRLSQDAATYMQQLGREYIDAGYPNHKVWQFDSGADTAVHNELRNGFGFIKLMGTKGAPYTLTDRGHAWIMAHGDALDSG